MNHRALNPALELLWSEEVRYLHSLWHNGPSTNPNPTRQFIPISKNTINNTLRPCNPKSFKKQNSKKKKKKNRRNNNNEESNPPEISGKEWPCEPAPEPRKDSGWPRLVPQSDAATRPASDEQQAKHFALQLHQKSLKASQDFFAREIGSDCEDGDEDEGDVDSMEQSEEIEFFLGIFKVDCELRSYYEKNCESGVFCCLVCGGIGKKLCKRFRNCVALVQHSIAIRKTTRMRAHRAFAQAVCQVLGWDMKRLPSIVVAVGEPLGRLMGQGETQPQVGSLEEDGDKVVNTADDAGGEKKEDVFDNVVETEGPDKDELKGFQVA